MTAVPIVLQDGFGRCGDAALAMVARAAGHEPVRDAVPRSASLADLVAGASRYGLDAAAVRLEPGALVTAALPLIAHLDGHHWVVVTHADADTVALNDPERGRLTLAAPAFAARWDGYAVCFA